ncbi:unnamed protein product [Ectocarpus sp. 6 AP-2014]
MMACWRIWALFSLLVLPGNSSQCAKKEGSNWHVFQNAIEASGLAGEDGIANILADLRTGALSQPVPHTYVVVGGGEWGPRVVAEALLESVYERWSNDVVMLDMAEQAAFWGPSSNLDKAQEQLNRQLCVAIERCVGRAVVVLDNVHLLQGEDLRVLDTMLSLIDGRKSNMECNGHKVSGEGCLFLLLLNEEGSEDMKRLPGKDRLLSAWEFRGMEFTTRAFVGRVDVAVSLSKEPSLVPEGTKSAWQDARKGPAPEGVLDRANGVWREVVKAERGIRTALREADRDTLQAVGVVATAAAVFACAVYFREASGAIGTFRDAAKGGSAGDSNDGGGNDNRRKGSGHNKEKAVASRGGSNQDDPSRTTADGPQPQARSNSDGPSMRVTRNRGRHPVETGTPGPGT